MKRILALHGFSQNATIFNKRLGALRKTAASHIEFGTPGGPLYILIANETKVFVDAPHILQPAELDAPSEELAELQSNPETAMRGWWIANKDRTKVTGLQESLLVIRDILKSQSFDGVFGFSQGGALAAIISSLLERPHIYPPFLIDGASPHPPFQFCIVVSGFKVLDPICDLFYTPNFTTPTLHVIGRTDVVVIQERSRQLIEKSENKRVEEHNGGHFVPSKGPWRQFFVAYIRDPISSHPSPEPELEAPSEEMSYRSALLKNI